MVDDRVRGGVGGGKGDTAARRGQACQIVGRNGFALESNVEADLFGAEGRIQYVHFQVRTGVL